MATGDAAAVLNTITSIGSAIRDLVDTGYRVSEKLKGFKQRLKQLEREREFWEAQISKFGLSCDRDLLKIFRDAKSQLEHEKDDLTKKINSRRWPKLKRALIPSQLEETILRVEKIFENVLQELQRWTAITGELQRRAFSKVPLLGFKEDDRYVRLDNTNKEVISALGNADGPPIVLLHGFSGTGKSSLARDVALQVQESINRRDFPHAGLSQGSGQVGVSSMSIATELVGSLMFEQVIFLECGPRVNLQSKGKELRDALGWNSASPERGWNSASILNPISREDGVKKEAESESDEKLMTILAGLLQDKPLLIILDDVWKSTTDIPGGQARNSQFLQIITDLGGKNVKWLVTSQEGDLCSNLNCKCKAISMEYIQPEVARRILALQVGFSIDEIPKAMHLITVFAVTV